HLGHPLGFLLEPPLLSSLCPLRPLEQLLEPTLLQPPLWAHILAHHAPERIIAQAVIIQPHRIGRLARPCAADQLPVDRRLAPALRVALDMELEKALAQRRGLLPPQPLTQAGQ